MKVSDTPPFLKQFPLFYQPLPFYAEPSFFRKSKNVTPPPPPTPLPPMTDYIVALSES